MARTITEIENQIFAQIANNPNLSGLNTVSKTAIYKLFVFVIAYACWLQETIFDSHAAQIDQAILEQKSGTANWYKNKAMAFQYGFDLVTKNKFKLFTDSDEFNNTGYTDEEIKASKIIKYCSIKESTESNKLIIKVATELGDTLQQLAPIQKEAFEAYMAEIKYAGVKLAIVNNPADILRLNMTIYRDPLVLDPLGNSIAKAGKPVETAINNYMKALPFNGELVLNDLIAHLKTVPGVNNAHIINASSSAYDALTNPNRLIFSGIYVRTIPTAGYFIIEDFKSITYDV